MSPIALGLVLVLVGITIAKHEPHTRLPLAILGILAVAGLTVATGSLLMFGVIVRGAEAETESNAEVAA